MASGFLEVIGPEYLEAGQNFYNYAPFRQAVTQAVDSASRVSTERVRRILTQIARAHHTEGPSGDVPASALSTFELSHRMQRLYNTDLLLNDEPFLAGQIALEFRPKEKPAIRVLGLVLADCFNWTEYIFMRMLGTQRYANDGDYIPPLPNQVPDSIQSYGLWLEEQRKLRVAGIEDIFEQDFASDQSGRIPRSPSRGTRHRRWRFFKIPPNIMDQGSAS